MSIAEIDNPLPRWRYGWGEPPAQGVLRAESEQFQVEEIATPQVTGDGDFWLLQIRKRDTNTEWLARQLAQWAGVDLAAVGYAGLKDRHAITTQWFSIRSPARALPVWRSPDPDRVELLELRQSCHGLQPGDLLGNRFTLQLTALRGDRQAIEERLQQLATLGVPNYFGEQRFGIDGSNLNQAAALFESKIKPSRHLRGLYLSAARSFLFNRVLQARIEIGQWLTAMAGEALLDQRGHPLFAIDPLAPTSQPRIAAGEWWPSGPLWGQGRQPVKGAAAALECAALAGWESWQRGLERAGLHADRRPLRLLPTDFHSTWLDANTLQLRFTLPPGCYATVVVREVMSELHHAP